MPKGARIPYDRNSVDLADVIVDIVENGFDIDNKVLELYEGLDEMINAPIDHVCGAHLDVFVWDVVSCIDLSRRSVSADEVVEVIKQDLLQALRKSLVKIFEEDAAVSNCATYCSDSVSPYYEYDDEGNRYDRTDTSADRDVYDVTDRELDPDFDDMEGK